MLSSNLACVNIYSWLEGRCSKCTEKVLQPTLGLALSPVTDVPLLSKAIFILIPYVCVCVFFFHVSQAILFCVFWEGEISRREGLL